MMVHDPRQAQTLRIDLAARPIAERKMFGGRCFLLVGDMLSGVHSKGVMILGGAPFYDKALTLRGVSPMFMGVRAMKGIVNRSDAVLADAALRRSLLDMAQRFVATLPSEVSRKRTP